MLTPLNYSLIAVCSHHIDLRKANGAVKIPFQMGTTSALMGSNGKVAKKEGTVFVFY